MAFRLCWLLLAIFLASCSGGSDSEQSTGTFDTPVINPDPFTPVQPGSAIFTYGADDSVSPFAVSEIPSSKAQTISLKGATIPFAATAGHLIAKMKAAIFYTAYTRDDQPRDTRPVTFVFNGGPGGASGYLDVDFLGPKAVAPGAAPTPANLNLIDNPNTLLDRTDLVFVDPVGTGYSTAVSPRNNHDFWGVDSDAEVLADFIIRYTNVNNRQSSPKYIYGVSYGGIRAPIMARLLTENGTSGFGIDPSQKPAKILNGLILNSPILDFKTDCYRFYAACGGALPTYAMIKRFHAKETLPPIVPFQDQLRTFAGKFNQYYFAEFSGVDQKTPDRTEWEAFLKKPEGPIFLDQLFQLTGIGKMYQPGDNRNNNTWIDNPNMDAITFTEKFSPGKKLELGDGRYFLTTAIDPAFDRSDQYEEGFIPLYQKQILNYSPTSGYMGINGAIIDSWDEEPDPALSLNTDRWLSSIPDMTLSMTLNSSLRVLVQHGYYDLNTPFHQSELNITKAGLSAKIPVKLYEGGHGVSPYDTGSYEQVMQELGAFYDQLQPKLATVNAAVAERARP